jgi:hypothetical protein
VDDLGPPDYSCRYYSWNASQEALVAITGAFTSEEHRILRMTLHINKPLPLDEEDFEYFDASNQEEEE